MPPKIASQQHWTFRFKQHKTTILLFVSQSQSFTSIKQDLLEAIKATGIQDIDGNGIPSDPEAIIFGVPVDKNDISKGWVALEIPELDDGMTNGRAVKKGSVLNQSPLGAGLKDGAMLAFKFRKQDAGADDLGMDLDDDWDVIMPSYDDEGSQSQGRV